MSAERITRQLDLERDVRVSVSAYPSGPCTRPVRASRMSVIERSRVQKAYEALGVALHSHDQSPRLDRGAMQAAMEHLDAVPAEQLRGAVELREVAEALILSRKGWERWGEKDAFLYDRYNGVGTGSVHTLAEALRKITRGQSS